MNTAALHHIDCEWHHDQYDRECTCGAASGVRIGRDSPLKETPMNSQAKTAVQQLKTAIDRIDQAKSNPQQLDQVVQELRQKLQQLEQQLQND